LTTENTTINHNENVARRGMQWCNWRVRRWHDTTIHDILRDFATVAAVGDPTNSVVPRDHGRGRIVLMTKHTTINHDNNVAREGNALVKRVVLLGGGGTPLLMETMQGTSTS
jgi:hypothetical protein